MNDEKQIIGRALSAAAVLVGVLLMFVPLVLVHRFHLDHPGLIGQRGAEAMIGVAVILRTTFRRLLRAGSTNLLRTSIGAFSRTSARTMTRRLARTSTRLLLGMSVRLAPESPAASSLTAGSRTADTESSGATPVDNDWALSALSTAIGFVALAVSFHWVVAQTSVSTAHEISSLSAVGGISLIELSLYAAVPLLCYVATAITVARAFGAGTRIRTAVDGLLLQSYFAGAGSFLPMTTDVEYLADHRTQSRIASCVLLLLYALHLILRAGSSATGSERVLFLSALLLVYCFVYSFPIRPLEGYWVWKRSKVAWVVVWLPILISFVVSMPTAILSIL